MRQDPLADLLVEARELELGELLDWVQHALGMRQADTFELDRAFRGRRLDLGNRHDRRARPPPRWRLRALRRRRRGGALTGRLRCMRAHDR
jgi:hypothetical protein